MTNAVYETQRTSVDVPAAALQQALDMLAEFARTRSLDEIQALASSGELRAMFPSLTTSEPTPQMPRFEDAKAAPSRELSRDEFQEFLKNT